MTGEPGSSRMPAEWEPHALTLVAWPQREAAWRGVGIEQARDCHAEVVDAIAAFESVLLVADPSQADDARARVTARNVEVVPIPIDDSWLRDSGPIFVTGEGGSLAGIDFGFNAWGEAFTPYDDDAAEEEAAAEEAGAAKEPAAAENVKAPEGEPPTTD